MSITTSKLHQAGVSLWLDNITRNLLNDGVLKQYIENYHVTGLTSNPTIFDQAIARTDTYNTAILQKLKTGKSDEDVFFELAIEDLSRAADLFKTVYQNSNGLDGWVSLEVSPLLAYDAKSTLAEAKRLHQQAGRDNLFIKIPGTPEGLIAVEEATFAGVPVNVTLLFSAEQYLAAAEAWLRGIERRIEADLTPDVRSVASIFISRWDKAVASKAPQKLRNQLGVAVAKRSYRHYRELLNSDRLQRVMNFGVQPQRLLWASTGTKDPALPLRFYIDRLLAPFTINTMPEKTLLAYADSGVPDQTLAPDGGDADTIIQAFADAGIDYHQLADTLQQEGADSFVASWNNLLATINAAGPQKK